MSLESQTEQIESRREFIFLAGKTAVLLSIFGCKAREAVEGKNSHQENTKSEPTGAEKFYRNFPELLQGASRIEKVLEIPGAWGCVVHIKQIHSAPYGLRGEDPDAETARREEDMKNNPLVRVLAKSTKLHQNFIGQVLLDIKEKLGIGEVYQEGLVPRILRQEIEYDELISDMESLIQTNTSILEQLTVLREAKKQTDTDAVKEIDTKIAKQAKRIAELKTQQQKLIDDHPKNDGTDAIDNLARKGEITRRAATTYELETRAVQHLTKLMNEGATKEQIDSDPIIYEEREAMLLTKIGENNDQTAVVVFGGDHDFAVSIKDWNERHPKKTLSLIVITPKFFDEISQFLKDLDAKIQSADSEKQD